MTQDERRRTRRLAGAFVLGGLIAASMYWAVSRQPFAAPERDGAGADPPRELERGLDRVVSRAALARPLAPKATASPGAAVEPGPSAPSGMERARSGASGAGALAARRPPIAVDDVSEEAAREYMARSAPNPRARDALASGYLKRLREQHGLRFTEAIDCRGALCKTLLVFDEPGELVKLGGIEVDAEVEFTYRLDIEKAPRELTLLSTERGRTFAELLGEGPGEPEQPAQAQP